MFGTYYEQSKRLPAENGFQLQVLKLTDGSIALREIGKIGAVVGIVCTLASVVFDSEPTFYASLTVVSGAMWFGGRKLAQVLEPHAQSMLEHFKGLERERSFVSQGNRIVIPGSQDQLQWMKNYSSQVLKTTDNTSAQVA